LLQIPLFFQSRVAHYSSYYGLLHLSAEFKLLFGEQIMTQSFFLFS
jgi:hypothetical protein